MNRKLITWGAVVAFVLIVGKLIAVAALAFTGTAFLVSRWAMLRNWKAALQEIEEGH